VKVKQKRIMENIVNMEFAVISATSFAVAAFFLYQLIGVVKEKRSVWEGLYCAVAGAILLGLGWAFAAKVVTVNWIVLGCVLIGVLFVLTIDSILEDSPA
jgi:hypothetical protein